MSRKSDARSADDWLLRRRLRELGLVNRDVEVHENSTVMVSVTGRGVVRVHRGYAYAGDSVLRAIVKFVTDGATRRAAREARQHLLDFPVHRYIETRRRRHRPPPARREDAGQLTRLRALHAELNALHFSSSLTKVPIRISWRMKRKLGEITLDRKDDPVVIVISGRHIERDGWDQVRTTMLHEMVHQWQSETGRRVDHGAEFRTKAREVGIPAAASRHVHRRHGK